MIQGRRPESPEGSPMWTDENRARYDRSRLRYPSDLTDAEWAHVEPLIPPAKRGGNRRHVDVREVVNGLMYILSTGCQWRAIPKDLPPRSTSTITSTFGVGTARSSASTARSTRSAGKPRRAKQVRPPRSSTARASRARKKGGLHRPSGLRRRQKGHGQKAPHPRRYPGLVDARDRPCRRHPGP